MTKINIKYKTIAYYDRFKANIFYINKCKCPNHLLIEKDSG